jgi:site-specific recombinase XerD
MNGSVIICEGKGKKSRIVFLGKACRKSVRAHVRHRMDNNCALWITTDAERLTYGGLRKTITKRAKLAGIKQPSPHPFRRALAINILRSGVDVFSLQAFMGHSNLKISNEDLKVAQNKGCVISCSCI